MSPQRTAAIVLRQLYLYRGSPVRIVPLFGWVVIDVILWGFITRYLNSFPSSGYNFVPALLGAVLLWDFFTRVMQGVTTAFFEDVWSRNFLNVFASPILISEYITGLVLSSIWTSMVGLVMMLLLARGVFGLSLLGYGLLLIPFFLVLFLCGIALGIFASALVLRMGPAAEWLIWPIPAMISPFAGGVLSALDAASMDAMDRPCAAAVLRLRRDASDPRGAICACVRSSDRHRASRFFIWVWPTGSSRACTGTSSAPV